MASKPKVICRACGEYAPAGTLGKGRRCAACRESGRRPQPALKVVRLPVQHSDAAQWTGAEKAKFRKYGLTPASHGEMFDKQGRACAICRMVVAEYHDLYVDHDHATGEIRGLLCPSCNTAIGLLKDDPELIRTAARYIEVPPHRKVRVRPAA